MSQVSAFAALDVADRRMLADWLAEGLPAGVDAVLDLSSRPWNVSGAGAIIGVFEAAQPLATWILVHHDAGWMMLRPASGFVSDPAGSLADLLPCIGSAR